MTHLGPESDLPVDFEKGVCSGGFAPHGRPIETGRPQQNGVRIFRSRHLLEATRPAHHSGNESSSSYRSWFSRKPPTDSALTQKDAGLTQHDA